MSNKSNKPGKKPTAHRKPKRVKTKPKSSFLSGLRSLLPEEKATRFGGRVPDSDILRRKKAGR